MIQRLESDKNAQFTLPPEAVLKCALHALKSSSPKIHYRVTFPTKLCAIFLQVALNTCGNCVLLPIVRRSIKQASECRKQAGMQTNFYPWVHQRQLQLGCRVAWGAFQIRSRPEARRDTCVRIWRGRS